MSDAVKRYSERQIADAYTKFRMAIKGNSVPETMDFIAATAYDALEAENVRLREALLTMRANAERWEYMASRMVHARSGPHVGWTLDEVYEGDDPESAIDAALAASNDKGDGK